MINLLEIVQQKLNFPALQKIDPNTQEVTVDPKTPDEERFSQAAIPSVLIALYNYSTTPDGAEIMMRGNVNQDWIHFLFGEYKEEAIQKIASYSGKSVQMSSEQVNQIAVVAINEIRQSILPSGTVLDVKTLMAGQRSMVLPFLPASLQMGNLLNNSTLDDRSNKMEGPVSNLIHAIGNIFSASDNETVKK